MQIYGARGPLLKIAPSVQGKIKQNTIKQPSMQFNQLAVNHVMSLLFGQIHMRFDMSDIRCTDS